jgi:hypothetical protein
MLYLERERKIRVSFDSLIHSYNILLTLLEGDAHSRYEHPTRKVAVRVSSSEKGLAESISVLLVSACHSRQTVLVENVTTIHYHSSPCLATSVDKKGVDRKASGFQPSSSPRVSLLLRGWMFIPGE